jgi:RTX calcium-binding nonapeptide repeat (4 copies)
MLKRSKILEASLATALTLAGTLAVIGPAAAGPATSARGRAYGAKLLNVAELPNAQAQVPPGTSDHDETNAVAADLSPPLTAGVLHVEGDASTASDISATMQSTIDAATSATLPASWNARGFAQTTGVTVGSLGPALPTLSANIVNAEAVSACVGGNLVHGSAAQVAGLTLTNPPALPGLPGTPIPIPPISSTQPNQVLVDALGIKLTFWETNWNPATLGTTNGSSTVFTNAVHLSTPLGDVVISHAESTAQCDDGPPPPPTGDTECDDGIDNDGDGTVDMEDPDCSSPDDDSEGSGGTPACDDGIDNDGDGTVDMEDPDCSSPDDDSEGSGGGGGVPRACRKPGAIVGTKGNDRLKGTPGKDVICGLAGKDVIRGRGARDKIFGNRGNDRMFGQRGRDRIRGHGGRDKFKGGAGKDRLYGNRGNDRLRGNAGNDRLLGKRGRDTLIGRRGRDRLRGGSGKDKLKGGAGNDVLNGQRGRDRCRPGSGHDRMRGCEITR